MRRSDREITDFDAVIEVMSRCTVCHVAFGGGEYPYVVPMNFGMSVEGRGVTLYFHGAAEGKKHDLIKSCGRAAFSMAVVGDVVLGPPGDPCSSSICYESVTGTGDIDYVPESGKLAALDRIMHQCDRSGSGAYSYRSGPLEATAVLRLRVNSLSGKRRKG